MLEQTLLFIIGLCVGSFLNVVIYREIEGSRESRESKGSRVFWPKWLLGRSFCDWCGRTLRWYDNIPLLSYLLLGGKCRFCHKKISFQYPLVELLTACQFVWLYWLLKQFSFFGRFEGFYSFTLLVYWLFIFSASLVIFVVDWQKKIIPDSVLTPAIFVCLLRLFFTHQWAFLAWALVPAGFFLFLYWITRGKGIGLGDVKLGFFIGLVLGWPQRILLALSLAFLTGALVGVILVLWGKKKLKSQVPFGPFLIGSLWIAKLWGDQIFEWYIGLLSS